VCCSEAGAVDLSTADHGTIRRGRLGPGQMLFVDPTRGLLEDADCKNRLAASGTYARWAVDGLRPITRGQTIQDPPSPEELERRQALFGYTKEELAMVLKPMATDAKEPTFSMGDDSPLPHLAGRPRPIHHYLKQRFAQVTNPPIDHLRERLVMSLRTLLGPRQPILSETPDASRLLTLQSFFVYPSTVETLLTDGTQDLFPATRLDAGSSTWPTKPNDSWPRAPPSSSSTTPVRPTRALRCPRCSRPARCITGWYGSDRVRTRHSCCSPTTPATSTTSHAFSAMGPTPSAHAWHWRPSRPMPTRVTAS
jgi:hypothetical protein